MNEVSTNRPHVSNSLAASIYIAQAALVLQRRTDQPMRKNTARQLANLIGGLYSLVAPVSDIERRLDSEVAAHE